MLFTIAGENYQVPTLWEIVRDLRSRVTEKLSHLPVDLRDAAVITVTELAENLVKYAIQDPNDPPTLSLTVSESNVEIVSQNVVESDLHARNVIEVVTKIEGHSDPMELYAEAIAETLDRRTTGSQQGFYRMAAIAEFKLKAELEGAKLTIFAARNMR